MSVVVGEAAAATQSGTSGKFHLSGLDGVRALAVAGVLLYHGDLPWLQGGFLGVDVFFVLSGFLITSLLVREIEQTGRLDIAGFYARRLRRLVPALLLLLLGAVIAAGFFVPDAAGRVRGDGLAALLYVSNWWLVFNQESYFEFISRPPLLQHLWSLAIEEQFYLLWPIAAYALIRVGGRAGLGVIALALSAASTVWMAYLAGTRGYPDVDPSRIYFGTDTHCMGLLLGAALASVWHPWHASKTPGRLVNVALTALGAVALAGVAAAYVAVGERSPLLYRGGFLAVSLVVCGLIVAASHPGSAFGRLLGMQPLRWMGERSYGLYLWHWPIFVMTRPGLDVPVEGAANLALRLVLTALVAELSYRFVEHPIRTGALGALASRWRLAAGPSRRALAWRGVAAAIPVLAVVTLAGTALAVMPASTSPAVAPDVAAAMGIENGGPMKVTIERSTARAPETSAVALAGSDPAPGGTSIASVPAPTTGAAMPVASLNTGGLTAVGDSVLLGARFQLERSIRGAQTDAEVGRQAAAILQRTRELQTEQLLAPTVLLHLGTNGYVTESQLRRSLRELADRHRVIVVNANAPRRWVPENNDMLARVVREYRNAVLVDWAAMSLEHPEFFASDHIHLSPSGQRAFVAEVIRAGGFPSRPLPLARTAALSLPPATVPAVAPSTAVPPAPVTALDLPFDPGTVETIVPPVPPANDAPAAPPDSVHPAATITLIRNLEPATEDHQAAILAPR